MADRRKIWVSMGPLGPDHYLEIVQTAEDAAEAVADYVPPPVEWVRFVPSDPGRTGFEVYPGFMGPRHIRLFHASWGTDDRPDAPLGPLERKAFQARWEDLLRQFSEHPPLSRRVFPLPPGFDIEEAGF